MVVDSERPALTDEEIDRIFRALADRTRRDLVRRAMAGEESVSALARHHDMSVTAVQKHVATLERAGLVTLTRRGRERIVRTDIVAVNRARRLLDDLEQLWRERLGRIDDLLAIDTSPGAAT